MESVTSVLNETEKQSSNDNGATAKSINSDVNADQQNTEQRYLDQFVGEGKKYKSMEEAAEALAKKAVNADSFIEELKREKEELAQKVQETKTIEDVLSALDKTGESNNSTAQNTTGQQEGMDLQKEFMGFIQQYEQSKLEEEQVKKKQDIINQNTAKFWELAESTDNGFGSKDSTIAAIKQVVESGKMTKEEIDSDGAINPEKLLITLKYFASGSEGVQYTSNEGTVSPPTSFNVGNKLTMDMINQYEKENKEALKNPRKRAEWVKYKHANYKGE